MNVIEFLEGRRNKIPTFLTKEEYLINARGFGKTIKAYYQRLGVLEGRIIVI